MSRARIPAAFSCKCARVQEPPRVVFLRLSFLTFTGVLAIPFFFFSRVGAGVDGICFSLALCFMLLVGLNREMLSRMYGTRTAWMTAAAA
jgi:hypothetical protein